MSLQTNFICLSNSSTFIQNGNNQTSMTVTLVPVSDVNVPVNNGQITLHGDPAVLGFLKPGSVYILTLKGGQ